MAKRIFTDKSPFPETWNAKWISSGNTEPHAAIYRNRFSVERVCKEKIHISADSVYILYLDGCEIGRGPELGEPQKWCFNSYELEFSAGEHTLAAYVFFFANKWDFTPYSKMSLHNGFLLAAEGEASSFLDTNTENWECLLPENITFKPWHTGGVGPQIKIDGRLMHKRHCIKPLDYGPGQNADPGREFNLQKHYLIPAQLPPMFNEKIPAPEVIRIDERNDNFYPGNGTHNNEVSFWKHNLEQGKFTIPPNTHRRILLRFDNYYCGFPVLACSGGNGASIEILWTEALSQSPDRNVWKNGDRLSVENRYFHGHGDSLICGDETTELIVPWIRAGRFIQLTINTGEKALLVEKLSFRESRYPLENAGFFQCSDNRLNSLADIAVRTLQMCSHDTYMDCPFYEQLMYLADAGLEMLLHYVLSSDRCLEEKSIRLFTTGRLADGMLQCRYPSFMPLNIPTFTLLYPSMVHNYILYCGNETVLREILPAMRSTLDSAEQYRRPDGLLSWNHLWSFIDWVDEWNVPEQRNGSPPLTKDGVSGVVNWLSIYAFGEAMRAHELAEEPEIAARYRRLGMKYTETMIRMFYNEEKHLFSDLPGEDVFSEHAQCLALLSGFLPEELEKKIAEALFARTVKMAECSVYFSFYYLEVCGKYNRMDHFTERLELWFEMQELNAATFFEGNASVSGSSRSDCHAWSAHILWHYYSTIIGIRPQERGFRTLRIVPHPGVLDFAKCSLPHPSGMVHFSFRRDGNIFFWELKLPDGVEADFCFSGREIHFDSGSHSFRTEA